jgi:hypothetical protein
MIYRFILVSDEVEDFRRDILIDSDATFLDLYHIILDATGYSKDQITSFFICDDEWVKQTEITLIEMDSDADRDSYVMERCRIGDLVDEEGQRLIYVFEPLTDRCFFMELREIIIGQTQQQPAIIKSIGQSPKQTSPMEALDFTATPAADADTLDDEEDFIDSYDEDHYDDEDLEYLGDMNPFDY